MKDPKQIVEISNSWEMTSERFISARNSTIGITVLNNWCKNLARGSTVLDIGCGFGVPNMEMLIESGFNVYGIDISITMLKELHKKYPFVITACEAAEDSSFFNKIFDGIISTGLIFLLSKKAQIKLLYKAADALKPCGRFLFSVPEQACEWDDILTGETSRSLGKDVYVNELSLKGLSLFNEYNDEGENHYFDFIKNGNLNL
jgi:predicted TPR repeat methyltransferase